MPLVSIDRLSVRFGTVTALEGITASIAAGSVTAIIGPNGSGKSTLLKAMLGLVPSTGTVAFGCRRSEVGYVPQRVDVDRNIPATVGGFVAALLRRRPLVFGIGRRGRAEIGRVLESTGAAPLADRPLGSLSGGEMQRVLLALALAPTPRLLLLDEAASGMDVGAESRLHDTIRDLARNHGVGVVMVSHDLSVVSDLTDHVLCVNQRLICEGSAADVLTDHRIAEVFGHHHGVYVHHHDGQGQAAAHGHHAHGHGDCGHGHDSQGGHP